MLLSTWIAQRLRESRMLAVLLMFIGLFWGFLFSIIAIKYMSINQQDAIYRAQTLAEGENRVIEIETYLVDAVNQGKLVHLSGDVRVDEMLKDTLFDMTTFNVLALRRIVKMYQWTEKISKNDEGVFDYTYEPIWLEKLIDSGSFALSQEYHNPSSMLIREQVSFAKEVKLGEFILPHNLIKKMTESQWVPMTALSFWQVSEKLASQLGEQKIQLYDGYYYIGDDPSSPQIGDLQIKFEMIQAETISVVAKQVNSSLMPYQTQTAGEIELFEFGTLSAEEMFYTAKKQNVFEILSESFGRFLIMALGFYLSFIALWFSKNTLPILGNPANLKGWLISVVLAAVVTLVIIGLSWIDYSPLIGRTLLVIAVSLLYFLKFVRHSSPQPTLIHEDIVPQKSNYDQF